MEEECYQESFSSIKERMLNTNELIMMVKNTCSKYQRVVEACKKMKKEVSDSTLKMHGLTMDNDRLNLLLQKERLSREKLEEEIKSLSADKSTLGEGYNKYMVQSQITIRDLENKLKMPVLKPSVKKGAYKTKRASQLLTKALERKVRSLNTLLRKETEKTKNTVNRYRLLKARLKIKAEVSKTENLSGPPINSRGVQTESDKRHIKSATVIEVGVQTENSENCDNCSIKNIREELNSYPSLLSPMSDDNSVIDLNVVPPDDTEHDYIHNSSLCTDNLPTPFRNQDLDEVERSARKVSSRGNGLFKMKYMRLKNRLKMFTRNLHLKYQRNVLEVLMGLQKRRIKCSKRMKRRKQLPRSVSNTQNLNASSDFEKSRNVSSQNRYESLQTVLNSSRLGFASNPTVPDSAINASKNYEEEAFLNRLVDLVSQRLQNEGFEKKDPGNKTLNNSEPRFESKGCQKDPILQLATVDVATHTHTDPCRFNDNEMPESRPDVDSADHRKKTELEVFLKETEEIEDQRSVIAVPCNHNEMSAIMNVEDKDLKELDDINNGLSRDSSASGNSLEDDKLAWNLKKLQETVPESQPSLSVTQIPDSASGPISLLNMNENPKLKFSKSEANIHVNVQTKDNCTQDKKEIIRILDITVIKPINSAINKPNVQLCKTSQENNIVSNNIDKLIKVILQHNQTFPLLRVVHIRFEFDELTRKPKFQSTAQKQIDVYNKYNTKFEIMTAGKNTKRKYPLSCSETSSLYPEFISDTNRTKKFKSELPESKATVQTITEEESNYDHKEGLESKILEDVKLFNFTNGKPEGQPSALNTFQDVNFLLKNDLSFSYKELKLDTRSLLQLGNLDGDCLMPYPEIDLPLTTPISPQCAEDNGENCSDANVIIIPNKREEMMELDDGLLKNDLSLSSSIVELDTKDLLELDNLDEEYPKSYLELDMPLLSPMSPQCEDDGENCSDASLKIIPSKSEEMIGIDASTSKPKCKSSSNRTKARTPPKTHLQRKLMKVVKLKKRMVFPVSQNTCKIKDQNINNISSQKGLVTKTSVQDKNSTSISSNFHSKRNGEDKVQQSVSPWKSHAISQKHEETNSLLTSLNDCNQVNKIKKVVKKVVCTPNSPQTETSRKNPELILLRSSKSETKNLDVLSTIMNQMGEVKPKLMKPMRENTLHTWIDNRALKRRMLDSLPILREKAELTQDPYPNWYEEQVKRGKFKNNKKTRHMNGLVEKFMKANTSSIQDNILVEFGQFAVGDVVKMILQKLLTNNNFGLPANSESQVLTPVQHRFIDLMVQHEKKFGSNMGQAFLEEVETEIWTRIRTAKSAVSITRVYTTVCKLRGEVVRIRNYFCAAFLRTTILCVPIMYAVLTIWPDVFPKEPESENFSPSKVIVYSVHQQKYMPFNRCSLYGLKSLLTTYYQYTETTWDVERMCEDFFKDYYNQPTFSKEYALQLFFKSQPREYLNCKLDQMFKPLVYRILNPEHLSKVILLMGRLCKISDYPLTRQQKLELCQCLLNYVTDTTPTIVKMSVQLCVEVLMRRN